MTDPRTGSHPKIDLLNSIDKAFLGSFHTFHINTPPPGVFTLPLRFRNYIPATGTRCAVDDVIIADGDFITMPFVRVPQEAEKNPFFLPPGKYV